MYDHEIGMYDASFVGWVGMWFVGLIIVAMVLEHFFGPEEDD